MKMVIRASENYFIEHQSIVRSWWDKICGKYVAHSGSLAKVSFQTFLLPSLLPLSLSSNPTLRAAGADLDVNRGWSTLWKLLSFYVIVPALEPRGGVMAHKKMPAGVAVLLERGALTFPSGWTWDDFGCHLRTCNPGTMECRLSHQAWRWESEAMLLFLVLCRADSWLTPS